VDELSTTPAHVPASRVYRTFALVGIRRKIVVESGGGNRLAGIITRGDLLEAQEGRLPRRAARGGGVWGGGGRGGGGYGGRHEHEYGHRDGGGLLLREGAAPRLSGGGGGGGSSGGASSRASRSLPATVTGEL
jgi:hypothetical protein